MVEQQEQVAREGDLVQIHIVALQPEERAHNLPEVTRAVPYEGWVKGFLLDAQATVGEEVRIKTFIGRVVTGTLAAINPVYDHDFGRPQAALNTIGTEAWDRLQGKVGE